MFHLFGDSISKGKLSEFDLDFTTPDSLAQRVYLKHLAKDTVLNFVARTMSTLKVQLVDHKNSDDWEYILNVRPNKNQSAAVFWQKFFYRLMDENEVLVIFTDDNQLLIADDYTRKKYAVYPDLFENVIVEDYAFKRTFSMDEVIFLDYNNEPLSKFTNGLFNDYGELFGRILEVAMRNNQIRGSVGINMTGSINSEELRDKLQNYVEKIFKSFSTNSVAIVPKLNGMEYEEYTNKQGVSNQSLEELNKMKSSLIDDIANAIGVPTALIYGEKSELDENLQAYRSLVIEPLIKKIKDELTIKVLKKKEYIDGSRIEVEGVLTRNPLDYAVQLDKLVSSAFGTVNEVRELFGWERSSDPEMDKHHMTKNYDTLKGGEDDNDEETENAEDSV